MKCKFFQATLETTEALKIWVGVGKHRAAGKYFIMVRTDPLEMDHLTSSDPPLQLSYLPMLFIIPTLMLLKNPTHREGFKKF